jgi:hypothetical protein
VGAGAAPPPKPTTPTSQRLTPPSKHTGQVGEQYGPSIAPFARARCPFSPLLRPCSPGGAARGSYTGQFSCFGPRSCFIAPVLDIPNGVWPLNGAVGRAYIRETVPTFAPSSFDPSSFFQLRNPNPNKQEAAPRARSWADIGHGGGGARPVSAIARFIKWEPIKAPPNTPPPSRRACFGRYAPCVPYATYSVGTAVGESVGGI